MALDLMTRVLVPLDGSSQAEEILSQLRRMLHRHESQLVLFQALPFGPLSDKHDAEKYLKRIAFQLTNDGFPSTYELRQGTAADSILAAASEAGATLIAMTTHGRSGPARWVLGSVAERVLQASPLPVLAARPTPSTLSRGARESLPVRNILIPLDGSPFSLGALDLVLKVARPVDAHVTLLHVTEPTPYEGRWHSPDETLKEADKVLREACIPARIDHRQGDPAEEIVKASIGGQADLIAMTTHGRSGPSRMVFGSVTAKVLRAATVPLLVLRSAPMPGKNRPSRGDSLIHTPPL